LFLICLIVSVLSILFIYNKETNSGIRAFSSSFNPWESSGGYLQTVSLQITSGKLTINNQAGLVLQPKGSAILSQNVSPPAQISDTTFTHKVSVIINNEIYYLCLKLEN
jgi:hypothetical protein